MPVHLCILLFIFYVPCVRGQSGTSSAKEGIGEVGVQHQEVSSPVFSADLASGQLQFLVNVVNFWQCMSCLLSGLQHE